MFNRPWHKLPVLLALLRLIQFRNQLRKKNLHDTAHLLHSGKLPKPVPDTSQSYLTTRTIDGSFNDLKHPEMGMAGTRFGRNVPLQDSITDTTNIHSPNSRKVSQALLTRNNFIPATILNINAASWIQFQTHDWFSHGRNQPDSQWEVPIEGKDTWPQDQRPMKIDKTLADQSRPAASDGPQTFINTETHWWDASQIYGSNQETIDKLRSHTDGKMRIEKSGFLPLDPELKIDLVAFPGTWWFGLSMLHTLFVKEHNSICDHLKQAYPQWDDEQLFNHARLINAALIAKIHTVEWTPAILPHPATAMAMNINWWGILGRKFKNMFGRIGNSEILSGIPGSKAEHHAAPYSLTEEFVSVYRMHPLVPDQFDFYSHRDGKFLTSKPFMAGFDKQARPMMEDIGMENLFYSFGIAHPGALTLHNYPNFLRKLVKPTGEAFDLAAVDILRDRERGVPRYNRFRELVGRERVNSFEEITSNSQWAQELRVIYDNDINQVDLMVGLYAEDLPEGFGFSDTAFRVFILMASRRLKSDRFFTDDYRAEIYTQEGLNWIENNSMLTVLRRHHPGLAPILANVTNAFAPWPKRT
ncbi:Animal haem peroxidase [Nitrosomonas aestuarii]|uniref:Animal haem peroxidase n=1 Tax=Nitrosomonas aestuarii TaxID=52441 RepID=A0A1I4EWL0_9PROT|nr:peroxidase family protein [Nitrosomonas aestuarii]SFL08531.1 Animal haem peroxidase [Nitrosomonas aestuarii]